MKLKMVGIWRRMFRRIGLLGVVAGMFTGGAMVLGTWALLLDVQGVALRTQRQVQTASDPASHPGVPIKRLSVGQHIDEFVSTFPPLSRNTADLSEVFKSAKRRNIPLPRGDYQLKNDINAALVVVTATFPMTAAYGPTKEFAADVLRALPHASMDELRMTRSAANLDALETSIRFSFVYRKS